MSTEHNLTTMSKSELRDYVLQNREDEEALHAYLDKVHTENPSSPIYSPEDNVSDALARYLERQRDPK
jgi:hypothetical protein